MYTLKAVPGDDGETILDQKETKEEFSPFINQLESWWEEAQMGTDDYNESFSQVVDQKDSIPSQYKELVKTLEGSDFVATGPDGEWLYTSDNVWEQL
jgi:hypothetical protein